MIGKNFGTAVGFLVALLLAWGVVRAANSRYQQRQQAILAACHVEQRRLGSDAGALRAKYPTPEQVLCRLTRVVPDGTAEVVVEGKFISGTQFLFDNDRIEVVKETTSPTEYRAAVRAAGSVGPDHANLYAYDPVRCFSRNCLAVYLGGK